MIAGRVLIGRRRRPPRPASPRCSPARRRGRQPLDDESARRGRRRSTPAWTPSRASSAQGAGLRRHRDRRLDRAGRAAALLLPGDPAASQRSGRVVVLGTPPARPARPARRPRSGRSRASPARSARRSAARRDRAARLRRAGRRGPARARPCASCSRRARPTSPARSSRIGTGVAPSAGDRLGAAAAPARSRWSPAPRAGSAPRSPRPSPATARTSSASTCPPLADDLARGRPARSAATRSTLDITADDAPARIADALSPHGGSTSSSTTPASPATGRSRRCPRSAGTR